jgi:hypothetical protein
MLESRTGHGGQRFHREGPFGGMGGALEAGLDQQLLLCGV